MGKKFIMSYSCGKDSTLALQRMINKGNRPLGLLISVDIQKSRSWFHGIPEYMLQEVSDSMGIELMLVKCNGEEYGEVFVRTLKEAKEKGAEACVFGDIDLEVHREWCTARCDEAGLEAVFPLWQEDREELTYEVIDNGFKAIIKNVKLECLGEEFLGQILNKEVVQKIKATGSDPCGENGEYHTFVFDGPLFKKPIEFKVEGNILNDNYGYLDIR